MRLLPIFLKLAERNCLVVGAGNVALDKIRVLLPTGPRLLVVAPVAHPEIQELASAHQITWVDRWFAPEDLEGQFLVIAATDDPAVNAAVYRGCVERNIHCNSVDDIPNCDFFFGSIVRRGPLQVAISTSGESPAFAQRLRREIDALLPEDLGRWLEDLGHQRREILATHPRGDTRTQLLHQLAERPIHASASHRTGQSAHTARSENSGRVALVGAGPGDPDLLTVKALRLIQSADVLLHDDLVPSAILKLAGAHAAVVNVGKRCGDKTMTQAEINRLLVEHAGNDRSVVRLKSGDPMLFGRAAEEIGALTEAGIRFEIVPGISAAFAAAASLGCSLTDRDCASSVTFSTGHHASSHNRAAIPALEDATRVVYMPGRDLRMLAEEWLQEGLPADLPCALVSHAAQAEQQVRHATLGELGSLAAVPAPSLLLAGWALRKAGTRELDLPKALSA